MKFFRAAILLCCGICAVLLAQNPVKIADVATGRAMIVGAIGTTGARYDSGILTIASGAGTTVTSAVVTLQAMHCNTINGTSSTITMQDGNGVVYLNAVAIAANGALFEQFGTVGMTFAGGVKITAGTTSALNCQIVGVK